MAKTKKDEVEMTTIVDATLEVPEEVKPYCSEIRVFVNAAVIEEAREIYTSLARYRGIPVNIDQEVNSINNAIAWSIYQNRPDMKVLDDLKKGSGTVKAIQEARHYYRSESNDATTEAMLLAVTMYTKIDSSFAPKPYEDVSAETFRALARKGMLRPDWVEDPLPPLERHLANNYERRLKQLWDIMQLGGFQFAQNFYMEVNQAIAQLQFVTEDGETDNANFQPKPVD